jgi:hypothetical protein
VAPWQWLQQKLKFFFKMSKFSKNDFLKEIKFVKENKVSFQIFWNVCFKTWNLQNSADMCQSRQGTTTIPLNSKFQRINRRIAREILQHLRWRGPPRGKMQWDVSLVQQFYFSPGWVHFVYSIKSLILANEVLSFFREKRIFPDFKTEIGENLMVGYAFV